MDDRFKSCITIFDCKNLIQAGFTRVFEDTARGEDSRREAAAQMWEVIERYDNQGIIMNLQFDPNRAELAKERSSVDESEWITSNTEGLATCTAC